MLLNPALTTILCRVLSSGASDLGVGPNTREEEQDSGVGPTQPNNQLLQMGGVVRERANKATMYGDYITLSRREMVLYRSPLSLDY